jgi:hypothetical protein
MFLLVCYINEDLPFREGTEFEDLRKVCKLLDDEFIYGTKENYNAICKELHNISTAYEMIYKA